MFMFSLKIHETKVRVVNDNRNLSTISNYYKIDYNELSNEDRFKLCKHYCKLMKNKQRDGTKILKTYKKNFVSVHLMTKLILSTLSINAD